MGWFGNDVIQMLIKQIKAAEAAQVQQQQQEQAQSQKMQFVDTQTPFVNPNVQQGGPIAPQTQVSPFNFQAPVGNPYQSFAPSVMTSAKDGSTFASSVGSGGQSELDNPLVNRTGWGRRVLMG